MAYKTVKELLTAICDAVRSKTGTTGKINHQDIPAKINAIASSGSSSGSGMAIKTGTTTSNVIDTGLSSVSLFVLYIGAISAQGLVQNIWSSGDGIHTIYCSSYSSYMKQCTTASSESDISIENGTVTWNGTGSKAMTGASYTWIAVGNS